MKRLFISRGKNGIFIGKVSAEQNASGDTYKVLKREKTIATLDLHKNSELYHINHIDIGKQALKRRGIAKELIRFVYKDNLQFISSHPITADANPSKSQISETVPELNIINPTKTEWGNFLISQGITLTNTEPGLKGRKDESERNKALQISKIK